MVKTSPSSAGCADSIPGQGTKTPCTSQPKKKEDIKQKQCCNKFSKDFKMFHIKKKKQLEECFLNQNRGPQTSSITDFGNLLERQIPRPHPAVLNQKL